MLSMAVNLNVGSWVSRHFCFLNFWWSSFAYSEHSVSSLEFSWLGINPSIIIHGGSIWIVIISILFILMVMFMMSDLNGGGSWISWHFSFLYLWGS